MRGLHWATFVLGGCLVLTACSNDVSSTTIADTSTAVAAPNTTEPVQTTTTVTAPPPPADVVLHSGNVLTVDASFSVAEAVAITSGEIVAVGTSSDLLARVGLDTTVVDLGGKTIVPGFVDPHTHALQHLAFDGNVDAMRAAQMELLAGGTTTTGAPNVKPDDLEGFVAFEAAGELIIRNHLYLTYNDECGEVIGDYYLQHDFSHDPGLRQTIAGVKIFADGGVCNAPALSEQYPDTVPDSLKARGFVGNGSLYVTIDEVSSVVSKVDSVGGIAVIHAIGDEGNRTALHGLDQANDLKPFQSRHRIDHNSFTTLLTDDELAIYGRLGLVPAVFSVPWADGCNPATTDAWRTILPPGAFDSIEDSAALRAANPDMRVSWHGDAPSIPGTPLQLVFTLITGGAVEIASGGVCYPEAWAGFHTVPIEEGLRMLTINAAAAMGIDERVGSIEIGKVADLLVLAEDPLGSDPERAIATNRPLVTMVDGRVHFCEGDLCAQFSELIVDRDEGHTPIDGLTVTASGFRDTHTPDLVFDGSREGEGFWSSGADPPGWIEVTFDTPATIAALRFIVFQNPPSDTSHILEIRIDGRWSEVQIFGGYTATGDVLEWSPTSPRTDVEAYRITTLESLSWPEWFEFEIDFSD